MGLSSPTNQVRIGLLGGSFDPIHTAHIKLANTALSFLGAESVQLIPAAAPWQRAPLATSPEHRAAMVKLAITGQPGLVLNTIELERGGPSYTVDTLRALIARDSHENRSHIQYVWILGADQLSNFCTWHQWQELAQIVELAVAARPGSEPEPPEPLRLALNEYNRPLHHLPMPEMLVSGSEIRRRLIHKEPVDGLVPDEVLRYINLHHLYQA
jgi:nicotinate-nucleotide adenylyltransferase